MPTSPTQPYTWPQRVISYDRYIYIKIYAVCHSGMYVHLQHARHPLIGGGGLCIWSTKYYRTPITNAVPYFPNRRYRTMYWPKVSAGIVTGPGGGASMQRTVGRQFYLSLNQTLNFCPAWQVCVPVCATTQSIELCAHIFCWGSWARSVQRVCAWL